MKTRRTYYASPAPRKKARTMSLVVKKSRSMKTRPVRRRSAKKGSKKARLTKTGVKSFGPPNAKNVTIFEQQAIGISSRTWGAVNLMRIPLSLSNGNNTRCSNQAHVSGVFHNMTIRNLLAVPVKYYEYWIIPKVYDSQTISDTLLQKDWFTVHGLVVDRDRNWRADEGSLIYNEPINPDRFIVLKKRVTMLAPRTGSSGSYPMGNLKNEVTRKNYIPINRKYNYGSPNTVIANNDGEPDIPIEAPVFYINYAIDTLTAQPTSITNNALLREMHIVTFFRDGESGM